MAESIDKILAEHRKQAVPSSSASVPEPVENEGDKFFSVLGGDVVDDPFLELRFKDGLKLCLPYRDIVWITYDPKVPKGPYIKVDFGSTIVQIEGRGLDGELFEGLKSKRVMWLKEADHEMQDHDKNKVFIKAISFGSPDGEDETPPE